MRAHQGYLVDNLLVDSTQPGVDNRASVERTLGRPSFEAQFNSNEWYYVARDTRQLAFSMPKAVDQTILRIRFDSSRSEEHTSELQSLMRISYAVFCLKKKKHNTNHRDSHTIQNQLMTRNIS